METTKLHALAQVCGVSPDWLLGKEGGAVKPDLAEEGLETGEFVLRETSLTTPVIARRAAKMLLHPEDVEFIHDLLRVQELDVRGGASYGGGIVDEEHIENGRQQPKVVANWGLPTEFVESELGLRSADMDIIKVRGDSMDDGSARGLASGDRVMVDRGDRDVRQGGIFVVFDGAGIIIKQVELDREAQPPRIVCKSLNGRYSPINLTLEEPVHIIGRVAARISRM